MDRGLMKWLMESSKEGQVREEIESFSFRDNQSGLSDPTASFVQSVIR